MTPTREEEAELARVNDLAKDVFRRLEIVTDDALDRVWADPGDYLWDCLDMRFSLNGAFGVTQERWTMRDVMFAFASAALAAGYVKRSDAEAEIAEKLKSPEAVYLNTLRGGIAKMGWNSVRNLYPGDIASLRNDALEEAAKAIVDYGTPEWLGGDFRTGWNMAPHTLAGHIRSLKK